jgi:hypothetical protein
MASGDHGRDLAGEESPVGVWGENSGADVVVEAVGADQARPGGVEGEGRLGVAV